MWNDLSLSEKSDLMRTYIRNGMTSLNQMRSHFDSFAKGGPKKTYKEWLTSMQERYPDIEFDSNKAQYDYERYFNENYQDAVSRLNETEARHFTDKYKLPGHPTFSDESVYSQGPMIGGHWTVGDTFVPSTINAQRYPWLYKAYKPVSEEDIYSHRFATGGPEEELYSAGTLPEVAVIASRIYDKDFEKTYKKYGKYAGISNKSQAYDRWLNDQGKLDTIKARRSEASRRALGVTAVGAILPFATAGAIEAAPLIANMAGRAGMSKAGQMVKTALDVMSPGTKAYYTLPKAVQYGVLGANSIIGGIAADEFRKNPSIKTGTNFVLSNPWTFNAVMRTPQALRFVGNGLNKTSQFLASPYTGKWTQFGTREYRFKPGYLGMNGTPVESKKVIDYNKSIKELIPKYNEFADYYGYKQVPDNASINEAENIIKAELDRHNTFYRGLTLPTNEDVVKIKNIIGNNASDIDVLEYLARTGSKNPANTYFSQDSRAGQYGENVGIFKRKYTLGEDPRTWIEDADFTYDITPATKDAPKGKVNYPWASEKFIEHSYPGEVRINPEDYTFEGWLPQEEWNPNGKIIRYVSPDAYKGSGNRWFNENQGQYKPNFTSKIAQNNVMPQTDTEWDAAYNAALKSGNMDEVQRLRNLHFLSKAENNILIDKNGNPITLYHGTEANWDKFDINKSQYEPFFGKGMYSSTDKNIAKDYGNEIKELYGYSKNPYKRFVKDTDWDFDPFLYGPEWHFGRRIPKYASEIKGKDGVIVDYEGLDNAEIVLNGKNYKYKNAITYDDNGNIIPLSKRDNFKINDLRYALLPFIGGVGYSLSKKK